MSADTTTLTNESGESLTLKLSAFLRQEFGGVIAAGGWPTSPPRLLRVVETTHAAGTPRSKLATIVDDVGRRHGLPLCLGIVDLAAPPDPVSGAHSVAGWGMDRQSTAGSTPKIWAMYAAFQLRRDVRDFIGRTNGVARSDIAARLEAAWRNSPIPELRQVARSGRMPRLARIFDFGALPADAAAAAAAPPPDPNAVDFIGIADCGVPADFSASPAMQALALSLERFHELEYSTRPADKVAMWEQLAALPFGQRMWLMTAWSDNAAATTCATDLGLGYIDAVLLASGLYDARNNIGARLAATYASPSALLDAGTWPRGSALFARLTEFRGASQGAAPRQAASVRALLAFGAALGTRAIISAADSGQMAALMRPFDWVSGLEHVGVGSFALSAIDELIKTTDLRMRVDAARPFKDAAAKLGIAILDPKPDTGAGKIRKLSDVAVFDLRTTSGPPLHWVVAFVSNHPPRGADDFDLASNPYGKALTEIVERWLLP